MKNEVITLRVTKDEKEQIQQLAKSLGVNLTELIRKKVLTVDSDLTSNFDKLFYQFDYLKSKLDNLFEELIIENFSITKINIINASDMKTNDILLSSDDVLIYQGSGKFLSLQSYSIKSIKELSLKATYRFQRG